jgi:hypothetical protein
LRQTQDAGIKDYIKRVQSGYTKYFNIRHNRVGPLFQGPYGQTGAHDDRGEYALLGYIHMNPLDYYDKKWREGMIEDVDEAIVFLKEYAWSSAAGWLEDKENEEYVRYMISRGRATPEVGKCDIL